MRLKPQRGAVPVEYVIAAVICTALIAGMVAVLVQYQQRLAIVRASRQPTSPQQTQQVEREPEPRPAQQTQQTQQRPATPPAPRPQETRQTPSPLNNTQASQNNQSSSRPPVVVTNLPAPTRQTPSSPGKPGKAAAYPSGEPRVISPGGRTRIEAENFDLGGEGVAYHDTTPQNLGGTYRPSEGVDISLSGDSEGEHAVTHTASGEWLNYTINVRNSGRYRLRIRASRADGGAGRIRVYFDGVDKSGEISLQHTGNAKTYVTNDAGTVELAAGQQVMRVHFLNGGVNVNWFELEAQGGSATPTQTASTANRTTTVTPAPQQQPVATPAPAPSGPTLKLITEENFDNIRAGQKPSDPRWSWSASGSVTVQATPDGEGQCLRMIDVTPVADCWVRQEFPEQKDLVTWRLRVRFNVVTSEFGLSLLGADKQAVLLYTIEDQLGYEDFSGKWQPIKQYEANRWYDIRIEANIKDKAYRVLVDNVRVGPEKVKFRNTVDKITAWMAGTSKALRGTMFIDNVRIEGR